MSVMLESPIFTSFLFILAGFIFGYLVWHQDRSGDEKRIAELEEKYAAANGSAETHRNEFLELKKSINIQSSDLEQYRIENEDLQAQLQDALSQRNSVSDLNEQQEIVFRQAGDELGRQTEIIDRLQSEKSDLASEVKTLHKKLAARPTEIEELKGQLRESVEKAALAKEQFTGAINEKTAKISEMEGKIKELLPANIDLKKAHEIIDRQKAEASQHAEFVKKQHAEIERLRSVAPDPKEKEEKERLIAKFNEVQGDREKMRAALEEQSKQIADLSQERETWKTQTMEMEAKASEIQAKSEFAQKLQKENEALTATLKEHTASNASLRAALVDKNKEIEQLAETKNQAGRIQKELENATRVVKTANDENSRIVSLLGERDTEIADLKKRIGDYPRLQSDLDQAAEALTEHQAQARELRQYNEKQAAEIGRLNQELKKVTILERQLVERENDIQALKEQSEQQTKAFAEQRKETQQMRADLLDYASDKKKLHVATQQVAAISAERQELLSARLDLESQVKKLSTQSSMHGNEAADLKRQLETKTKAYEKLVNDSRELGTSLKQQQSALNVLESDLKSAQKLFPENKQLRDKVAELSAALTDLSNEHEQSLATNAKAQRSIRDLQNEVHESAQTIRELRRPRGSILKFGQDDGENRQAA